MATAPPWCRVLIVGPEGTQLACFVLEGKGAPDISAVDALAQLALFARRLGGDVVVAEVSVALSGLLELAGLGLEMQRQPELGEESLGLQKGQEERHLGDPAL